MWSTGCYSAARRKLLRKAKLKRDFVKLLKREGIDGAGHPQDNSQLGVPDGSTKGAHGGKADASKAIVGAAGVIVGSASTETGAEGVSCHRNGGNGDRKRRGHRPDPFRGAKVRQASLFRVEDSPQGRLSGVVSKSRAGVACTPLSRDMQAMIMHQCACDHRQCWSRTQASPRAREGTTPILVLCSNT